MAFSKSLPKGQIPMGCKLCEGQVPIKWKCLYCDLLMCENCRKIHIKTKDADKHMIQDIQDIGKNTEGNTKYYSFDKIPCKSQPGETYCLFWRRCDKLSCPICVSTNHKQHDLIPIKDGYERKIDDMKKEQSQLQIRDQEFATRELILEYMRKIEKAKHEKSMEDVLSHNKVLKNELDKYTNAIKDKVDNDWKSNESDFDNELMDIQNNRKQLDQKNKKMDALSNPSNPSKCFDKTEGVTRLLREPLPTVGTSRYRVQSFAFGQIQQSNVGTLKLTGSAYPVEFIFQLSGKFDTELSFIDCIVAVNNNVLWIKNRAKSLQKVTLSSSPIGILPGGKIEVWGIVAASRSHYGSQTFLIATREPSLKQMEVTSMELTDSRYCVAPWLITSVHVTKDDKVIIGATDREKTRNAIICMNYGKQEVLYESSQTASVAATAPECSTGLDDFSDKEFKSKRNQLSFGEPTTITSTIDKNIFLIDENQDNVTVLNEGEYVCTYKGNTRIGCENKFTPTGMTATPTGRVVLVVDPENNIIHILDSIGEFVTYYRTTDIGITKPCCLDFCSQGQLYIGCATEEAKIYELKYSEQ